MDLNWGGVISDLMLVQHPSGTQLSESRSTPGKKSALLRDDDRALSGHAVLSDADKLVLAILGVGFAAGVVTTKIAPPVKDKLISLKSKMSRRAEEPVDAGVCTPLTVTAEVESEQPGTPHILQ